eukprot:s308_g60.t1
MFPVTFNLVLFIDWAVPTPKLPRDQDVEELLQSLQPKEGPRPTPRAMPLPVVLSSCVDAISNRLEELVCHCQELHRENQTLQMDNASLRLQQAGSSDRRPEVSSMVLTPEVETLEARVKEVFLEPEQSIELRPSGDRCMSAQLEGIPGADAEGEHILLVLLCVALAGGALLGVGLTWLILRPAASVTSRAVKPESWARIVLKALRFLRKRRRIALAWSNYRNHKLRQLPAQSEGRALSRQGSSSAEERPLQEGPAIRHGAHRRRA